MKYASYIIATVGTILLFNIFLSYSSSSYKGFLKDTKSKMMGVTKEEVLADMNKDQIEINSKILNSLDKLNENLENLKKQQTTTQKIENTSTLSGEILDGTGEIIVPKRKAPEFPGSLLVKLMPKFLPQKIQNSGIFGIKDDKFGNDFEYLTYNDFKKQLKIFVFNKGYGEIQSEFKINNTYKINETNTFYGYSFFLNPIKKDKKVRFITSIEAKAIGFEIDSINFEALKKALNN